PDNINLQLSCHECHRLTYVNLISYCRRVTGRQNWRITLRNTAIPTVARWRSVTILTHSVTYAARKLRRLDKVNMPKYCYEAGRECRNRTRTSMWERTNGASAALRCS